MEKCVPSGRPGCLSRSSPLQTAVILACLLGTGEPGHLHRWSRRNAFGTFLRLRRHWKTSRTCSTTRPTSKSFKVTALFSAPVAGSGIALSLTLAIFADRILRGGLACRPS